MRSRLDQAKPFLCRESTKSDYPKGQLNVPGCTKGLYAGPVVCQDELGGEMEAYVECPADVVAKDGFTGCYKAALFRAAKGSRDKTEISLPETNSESAQ